MLSDGGSSRSRIRSLVVCEFHVQMDTRKHVALDTVHAGQRAGSLFCDL